MQTTYTVTGTLTDANTITLDEAVLLTATKVRVVIEPLENGLRRPYSEVIAEIRREQEEYGHRPLSKEAVDEYIKQERDSWE